MRDQPPPTNKGLRHHAPPVNDPPTRGTPRLRGAIARPLQRGQLRNRLPQHRQRSPSPGWVSVPGGGSARGLRARSVNSAGSAWAPSSAWGFTPCCWGCWRSTSSVSRPRISRACWGAGRHGRLAAIGNLCQSPSRSLPSLRWGRCPARGRRRRPTWTRGRCPRRSERPRRSPCRGRSPPAAAIFPAHSGLNLAAPRKARRLSIAV